MNTFEPLYRSEGPAAQCRDRMIRARSDTAASSANGRQIPMHAYRSHALWDRYQQTVRNGTVPDAAWHRPVHLLRAGPALARSDTAAASHMLQHIAVSVQERTVRDRTTGPGEGMVRRWTVVPQTRYIGLPGFSEDDNGRSVSVWND
ncbi:MAG: hypothetical protein HUU02_11315 [Bacteroidetes bacterium]|nr:hypothetical protein [Bacteroidota bacterium]